MLRNWLAKSITLLCILDRVIECRLGNTNRSSSYVDTPDFQAAHDMLKAFTLNAPKQVSNRNSHISKYKFGSLNTLVSKLFKRAAHIQSRSAFFNQEDTHSTIGWLKGCIGASQNGKDTPIHTVCNPEFRAIEHIIIAISYGSHGDGLHVTARICLRNADSSAFITQGHDWQEALALLLCAKCFNHIGYKDMSV